MDDAVWTKLKDIDSRAGRVRSLAAEFEQQRFTAMLRKPLVSSGAVRIKGSVMRWDTQKPEPSVLWIDQKEARVYYPAQKLLEIYPLDKRLGELAASPLPRLDVLKARFSFEQIPVAELDKSADAKQMIALRLSPLEPSLRKYVKQVRVLLDVNSACIIRAEVTDGDDERTVLRFHHVQLDADVGDLALKTPPGTTVSHPLEGPEAGGPPQSRENSK